jgi:hypothetical protein
MRWDVTDLSGRQIVLKGSMAATDEDEGIDSRSQRFERSPTLNRTAPRANGRGARFADLLDGLETCVLSSSAHLPRSSHLIQASFGPPTRGGETTEAMGADVSMRSVSHAQGILESLRGLDKLDSRAMGLSVATNFAYWKLGMAYDAFCIVSRILGESG